MDVDRMLGRRAKEHALVAHLCQGGSPMTDEEALLDYRRSVAAMYARVRQPGSDGAETCQRFRQERDALFRSHPQSALSNEQKAVFHELRYYDYNPAWRFLLPVDPNV